MRNFPRDATISAPVPDRRQADADLYSSGECEPLTPLQMFTRLGVLLLITLGFGLVVQFLASMPH